MNSAIRILGAGGHAKVAAESWLSAGGSVLAFHDDREGAAGTAMLGIPVDGGLAQALAGADPLHIAIGDNDARRRIAGGMADARFPPLVHRSALVSPSAQVGAGTLVCAGAVVQAEARIGRHAIVNTLALVEHDVVVGDYAHIAPGARIAGGVSIGAGALVGLGAVILPGLTIGDNAIVGAGAVVLCDVGADRTVVGNPARFV